MAEKWFTMAGKMRKEDLGGEISNPTPQHIRAARIAAGLTQKEAANLVQHSQRAWENWESASNSGRSMHPAIFELFLIKTHQLKNP